MNRLLAIFIAIILTAWTQLRADNQYLQLLDSAIAERSNIMKVKERQILTLERTLGRLPRNEELLKRCYEIYQEYLTYRYDSALVYIQRCLHLAKELGNTPYYQRTVINAALLDTRGGLYSEAADYLKSITPEDLSQPLRFEYYNAYYWLYMNKRNYVSDEREKEKLFLQMEESLKQAIANADSGSADYYYLKGEHLHIYDKQYDSAILSYEKVVSIVPMRSKLYASATYALASCYLKKDDLENYEQWLTRAAISDILTPLKENFALQELSMYLFQKDNSNVDRSTTYIYCSMEDAQFFNDRPHIINISQKFPVILTAYTEKINRQKSHILYGTIALGILTLAVLAALLIIKKQNAQLNRRRVELQAKNDELHQQHEEVRKKNEELHLQHEKIRLKNTQLEEQGKQLEELNKQLIHTNRYREGLAKVYIDLCAKYIEKLKKYHTLVKRKIKANQVQELLATISSSRISEEDAATFMNKFDKAFLDLYPTFVTELNTLLLPENQISVKQPNTLTPELRIYALIRLGVKESSEIADLLFFSPQTIYNYRSSLKAKAANKDTFEDDVLKLCTVIGLKY